MGPQERARPGKVAKCRRLVAEWFQADAQWNELYRRVPATEVVDGELRNVLGDGWPARSALEALPQVAERFRAVCKALADLADADRVDAETALPLRELAINMKAYPHPFPKGPPRAFGPGTVILRAKCWPRVRRILAMLTGSSEEPLTAAHDRASKESGGLATMINATIEMFETDDEMNDNYLPDWTPDDVAKTLGFAKSSRLFNRNRKKDYLFPDFIEKWKQQKIKIEERKALRRRSVTHDKPPV